MGARKSDGRKIGTQVGIHFLAHNFLPAKRRAIAIKDLLHSDTTSSNAIPNNIGPIYVNMADSVPDTNGVVHGNLRDFRECSDSRVKYFSGHSH